MFGSGRNLGMRIAATAGAVVVIAGVGAMAAAPAEAATAAPCNAYAAVLAGQGMECTVEVDNYQNGASEYSTISITECHGAAYTVLLAPACLTTVIDEISLTTAIDQCNGTLNGGGSNVTCTVRVRNHLSGSVVPALATVNQCVGSGDGGTSPVGTPLNCSPSGLTSGATVTQCNGSVNGGGSPLRVNCSVPIGTESALPILINQCNGTVNGGGSALFCSVEIVNDYNVTSFPVPPIVSSIGLPTASLTGGSYGVGAGPDITIGVITPAALAALVVAAAVIPPIVVAAVVPPVAVVPAAATPAQTAALAAAQAARRAAALAATGSDPSGPILLAGALLLLGSLGFAFGRGRRHGVHSA
jgi:LPXTG-motif cell wall-anchored protein